MNILKLNLVGCAASALAMVLLTAGITVVVPEPSSIALVMLAFGGLAFAAARPRRLPLQPS